MSWPRIKRWLYRGDRPGTIARLLNRGQATLYALGIAPDRYVRLEVRGRRSGRLITFPLVMAVVDGERYLVSMLGTGAAWVRNVAAAGGRATLRHGRTESVRLEEVAVADRAPILQAYLRRASGARPHIPIDKDAPRDAFAAVAPRFPVFRVVADD